MTQKLKLKLIAVANTEDEQDQKIEEKRMNRWFSLWYYEHSYSLIKKH